MNIKYTDNDYFNLFKKGNQKGIEYLFELYYPELVSYSFSITKNMHAAEDLACGVFIPLWDRREQFESLFGVKAFLYICVKNRAISEYKKNKTKAKFENELTYLGPNNEESVLEKIIYEDKMEEALTAISNLPKGCQQVIRMIYLEGKTYKEIAKELNLSINTVRNHRSRGIMLIKKYLLTAILFTAIHQ